MKIKNFAKLTFIILIGLLAYISVTVTKADPPKQNSFEKGCTIYIGTFIEGNK